MKYLLINAVSWFGDILIFLLLGRAVLSWFVTGSYNSLYRIYEMVCNITEPIVAPCRRLSMRLNTGMLDLSVFFAFFLVSIVRKLIITILLIVL
ncbi:YggT family protein [Aminipila sp.]|uniref:YggT family protein n=1 Tax=Aminipila sp. TaxID=2060095 RepID=UPI0028966CEA|nr:YggT family protein [Aminipila sp.]